MIAADDGAAQQPGAFEHADVLGDRVQRDREVAGDLGDARVGIRESREDGAPRGIAQRVEDAVELRGLIFTHMGEYRTASASVNAGSGSHVEL